MDAARVNLRGVGAFRCLGAVRGAQRGPLAAARAKPQAARPHTAAALGLLGAPAIGESALALARQSVGTWRKADDTYDVPQVRTGQAGRYRQAQAGGPYRRITLERIGASAADWGLILNRLYLASLGGLRNSDLVWDESVPSRVVYGAIDAELALPFGVTEPHVPHRLQITGYAPPVWTA